MKSKIIFVFCIFKIKLLKKFTAIKSSHYINGRKCDCDKRSQVFYLNFHWSKDVDENLKHEIQFIIKSNEYLAEIENDIEQILLKCKRRNNIHQHRKLQNTWAT